MHSRAEVKSSLKKTLDPTFIMHLQPSVSGNYVHFGRLIYIHSQQSMCMQELMFPTCCKVESKAVVAGVVDGLASCRRLGLSSCHRLSMFALNIHTLPQNHNQVVQLPNINLTLTIVYLTKPRSSPNPKHTTQHCAIYEPQRPLFEYDPLLHVIRHLYLHSFPVIYLQSTLY